MEDRDCHVLTMTLNIIKHCNIVPHFNFTTSTYMTYCYFFHVYFAYDNFVLRDAFIWFPDCCPQRVFRVNLVGNIKELNQAENGVPGLKQNSVEGIFYLKTITV